LKRYISTSPATINIQDKSFSLLQKQLPCDKKEAHDKSGEKLWENYSAPTASGALLTNTP
jgi:hypothetical protein